MPLRLLLASFLLFASWLPGFSGPPFFGANVRIDPSLDAFMQRIAVYHGIPLPNSYYSQPMQTADIQEFLLKADALDRAGRLSLPESILLKKLSTRLNPAKGLVAWHDTSNEVYLNVRLGLCGDLSFSSGTKGIGLASPLFSGSVGNISFYSGIDVWTEGRSDTLFPGCSYEPYDGIPYNLYNAHDGPNPKSHFRSSDIPRGGITVKAGNHIRVETAIDYLKTGPSFYYPVTLSGTAPPITFARVRFDLSALEYSHIAGLLQNQKDRTKYFYQHRLNIPLWKNRLILGVNEMIVYGSTTDQNDSLGPNALRHEYYGEERGPSWIYLIPFVPFKFAEHYGGDRDNALISLDADLRWPDKYRFYGEFLIDDMVSPWKIFGSFWSNKWAATVGGQYFTQAYGRDVQIDAEYSHVEPWVYTHFYGGSHSYSNFNSCLGSPLGPNSQAFVLAGKVSVCENQMVGMLLTHIAQNPSARGGKFSDVFQDSISPTRIGDNSKKTFLGPGTVWQLRPGLVWNYNPFGLFSLNARIEVDVLAKKAPVIGRAWGALNF